MKNVTIVLDEETARWCRIRAAERGTSVSRLVGEMLRERMVDDTRYRAAMERYLSLPARPLRREGQPLPGREELHDRAGLR